MRAENGSKFYVLCYSYCNIMLSFYVERLQLNIKREMVMGGEDNSKNFNNFFPFYL